MRRPPPMLSGACRRTAAPVRSALRRQAQVAPVASNRVLQCKPDVGRANDPLEREADRVAEQVLRGDPVGPLSTIEGRTQRKCAACEAEDRDEVRRQSSGPDRPLQDSVARAGPQAGAGEAAAAALAAQGGQPLSSAERAYFEPRFGQDFSSVRIHDDPRAQRAALAIRARAFTLGHDLAFAPGQYASQTADGRRTLAHELAHVVQQSANPGDRTGAIRRQPVPPGPLEPPGPLPPYSCSFDILTGRFECCATLPSVGRVCAPDPRTIRDKIREALEQLKKRPGGKPPVLPIVCPESRRIPTPAAPPYRPGSCCPEGQVWTGSRCGNMPLPTDCKPQDCRPDEIFTGVNGFCCIPRAQPPPPPPPPAKMTTREIFFDFDRPWPGAAGSAALDRSVTSQGKTDFAALVAELKADPTLQVQLIGSASSEGKDTYNFALAKRRASMIADALGREGIGRDRIADPPEQDLRPACQNVEPGIVSCGEAGAGADAKDRRVLVRIFGEG